MSLCTTSCTFDTSTSRTTDGQRSDGAPIDEHDADPLVPDAASSDEEHLLLSEIKTTGSGKEFIEIYNPKVEAIDLSNYYIADVGEYASLPGFFGEGPSPAVNNSDFIARFPQGASIAGGQALTMAVRPTTWNDQFGTIPDYRIGGEPTGQLMREAFGSSIGPLATLTDSGEGIALFRWDGESDLVVDIDLADLGPKTSEANRLPNKTEFRVDGPDSGSETSPYKTDLSTMTELGVALEFGQSYHRLEPETGHETHGVRGNGDHGHDETTEDIATTWGVEVASPGVAAVGL